MKDLYLFLAFFTFFAFGCFSQEMIIEDPDADDPCGSGYTQYYRDADGDGYGNPYDSVCLSGDQPGYTLNDGDCNDNDARINPGTYWYRDADGDGAGDVNNWKRQCLQPSGYVLDNLDCNDSDASIYPGATEINDGKDNDCDGIVDNGTKPAMPSAITVTKYCDYTKLTRGTPPSGITWFWQSSAEGTSTGNSNVSINRYSGTVYYLRARDNSTLFWSDARSVTYSIDQPSTWYADADGDGYGNSSVTKSACTRPSGYVSNSTDCNDSDASTYPGATEINDGKDNDCDGIVDNGTIPSMPSTIEIKKYCDYTKLTRGTPPSGITWYWQSSSTGTSTSNSSLSINRTSGTVYYLRARDNSTFFWSDARSVTYSINKSTTWYADADGDGYGNPSESKSACSQPSGYVSNSTDCNDSSSAEYPGAIWYSDADGDGFGDAAISKTSCNQPAGYVANNSDQCPDSAGTGNGCPSPVVNALSNNNYVFSRTYQNPVSSPEEISSATDVIDQVTYFDGLGRPMQHVAIRAGGSAHSNILSTNSWKPGSGSAPFFNQNGATTENERVFGTGPFGKQELLWKCGNDAESNADGGWNTDYFPVDKNASYRYSVWVKRTDSQDGSTYHGTRNVDNLDGTANNNPYFWSGDMPAVGEWYLLVGVVHPYTYGGGNSGISGVYDKNGNRVKGGRDFKWRSSTVNTQLRNYLYYATTPATRQYFAQPLFQKLDGTESSITDLLTRTNKADVVTHIEYDAYGRQTRDYLPVPLQDGNTGAYRAGDMERETASYYLQNFAGDFPGMTDLTANPYSEKLFEASPLNRLEQQATPGHDWRLSGGNEIKIGYFSNGLEEVLLYKVTLDTSFKPSLSQNTSWYYEPGQLYKTITKDENWTSGLNNTTEEFKDKQGRVVLKRTYADTDLNQDGDVTDAGEQEVPHNTYYVYDDYGNLTYVIPPKADTSDGISQEELDELCYQYKYDHRNRLVEKKIPGKGDANTWESIVYNKLDQPILTQDPNLKEKDQWLFTKYDAFGRVVYTGLMGRRAGRATLQGEADSTTGQFERRAGARSLGGTTIYYTNEAYPNTDLDEVHTENYYDTYLDPAEQAGITVPTGNSLGEAISTATKGLSTVSKIRILGTSNWTTTVSAYDDKGRAVWNKSINPYLETTDLVESDVDFTGKVLKSKTTHNKTGQAAITTIDTYSYDHMGRLLEQKQKVDTNAYELIARNTYDELGQLAQKQVGGAGKGTGLQKVDYAYNVRGWLKKINDPGNMGDDLFGFEINYNDSKNGTSTPLYNGNISETHWNTQSENNTNNPASNQYAYSYDPLNRITGAIDNTGHYNLSGISYDKMGNILSLQRQGQLNADATLFGNMDDLAYSYDGNQLQEVTDSGNDSYGFKDGSNTGDDYTYDPNGNLTSDANKGITSILWNHLNMPTEIKFNNSNTQKINYTYTADGSKVRKVVSEGGNLTTTDYAGAYQYVNNDLEFIRNFEDGYVYPKSGGGFGYAFYYTDQLDNIRLAYTDTDGNGSINPSTEIIKESHFYPFGMLHKGYNSVVNPIGSSLHKYDYQNQERQDELGLNWLQFKYRMHDPEIGRFISVDPLAEDYVHNSTYAFAENKVIKYNELEGLEITLNKFDRMSYDNKSWAGKAGAFAANAGISIANGAIDAFNYAGDLTDPNAPLTGLSFGANKLASDAGDTASAISSYAENTTLSEFGSDVGNVLSEVETYENLAGALISGAGATKLGSVSKLSVADKLQNTANTALKKVGDGKGAVHGTKVHTEFGTIANKVDNVTKEVSYKNGEVVPYGTKGSVRADAVEGNINKPTAIYDLKTGKAKVTQKNINKYNQHVPGKPPVKEIKPDN